MNQTVSAYGNVITVNCNYTPIYVILRDKGVPSYVNRWTRGSCHTSNPSGITLWLESHKSWFIHNTSMYHHVIYSMMASEKIASTTNSMNVWELLVSTSQHGYHNFLSLSTEPPTRYRKKTRSTATVKTFTIWMIIRPLSLVPYLIRMGPFPWNNTIIMYILCEMFWQKHFELLILLCITDVGWYIL